jgi:tRNA/rRNA methyltransferase
MISFILVEPQMGENIGACARIMANFDFCDLRIINPRDGWPNEKAISMAVHATGILDNAKIFNNLKDALEDIDLALALTARERGMNKPCYILGSDEIDIKNKRMAFVFGAERTGLSNDDTALCSAIININTSKNCSSLNLAQALAIVAYQFSQVEHKYIEKPQYLASPKQKHDMVEHLTSELEKTNFFREKSKIPIMTTNITNMFSRMDLSDQEVQTLRGVIRALGEKNV